MYYTIKIKTSGGQVYETIGGMEAETGDRIRIANDFEPMLNHLLSTQNMLSFYIVQDDRPSTQYHFNLESSNYATVVEYLYNN